MFPLTPPKSDVFISVAVVIIAVVRRYLAYMGKSPLAASRSCSLAYLIQCLKESKRLKDFFTVAAHLHFGTLPQGTACVRLRSECGCVQERYADGG